MTNKRLIIENLDNLQELKPEGVLSIQGGMIAYGANNEYDIEFPKKKLEELIPQEKIDRLKHLVKECLPEKPLFPCKPRSWCTPCGDVDYWPGCPTML